MSDQSFQPAKATSTFSTMAFALCLLLAAACGVHYAVCQQQAALLETLDEAQMQYAQTQRVGMMVAGYLNTRDESQMSALKEAAANISNSLEVLTAKMVNGEPDSEGTRTRNAGLLVTKQFIDKAYSFIGAPDSDQGHSDASILIASAQRDIPDQWGAAVADYMQAGAKRIQMLTYVCYGLVAVAAVLALFCWTQLFQPAIRFIAKQQEQIQHVTATDLLTGLFNRTNLFKVAAMLISGAKRHKLEMAALAIDIDGLKEINDTYGRTTGDAAIKAVSGALREALRQSDVMGRLGGGEFAAFLPSTDEYRATHAAEKLRLAVADLPFGIKDKNIFLRVSIGVAEMKPEHKSPDDILKAASRCLTIAKQTGRNKVVSPASEAEAQAKTAAAKAPAAAPAAAQ